MKKNNQHGFSPTLILTVIASLIIVSLVTWKLWDTYKPTQQTKPTNSTSQSTQNQTTDPNSGYVVIKEWGVRFKPVEGLEGVEYGLVKFGQTRDVVAISTQGLAKLDPGCGVGEQTNLPFGGLERASSIDNLSPGATVIKHIGNYYFIRFMSQSVCAGNTNPVSPELMVAFAKSIATLEAAK